MTRSLLNADWLRQLGQYNRLIVGFSGGLDSTVLLHNLASHPDLVNKLMAVHINHGLSPNALSWQKHCQQICAELNIALIIKQVDFARQANIEEEARKARYQAFAALLGAKDCLILGHHLDDQAETMLLQLFRGAGIDGLAAMTSKKEFLTTELFRPLLEYTRQDLENYASEYQLRWIEDESNKNTAFARNFIRHKVLPLLRTRWPAVANNLVRTSYHCQAGQRNLDALAKIDCPALHQRASSLPLKPLNGLPPERLANVLRFWLKSNKIKSPPTLIFNRLLSEVIQSPVDAEPLVAWKAFCVRRYQQTLYLMSNEQEKHFPSMNWSSFPEPLLIEGLGSLVSHKVSQGFQPPAQGQFEIRFRRGGELFNWHGQTKQLKKLLQDWRIPPWQRHRIPLLYVNGQLAVIIGYAVSDCFYTEAGSDKFPLQVDLQLADLEIESC